MNYSIAINKSSVKGTTFVKDKTALQTDDDTTILTDQVVKITGMDKTDFQGFTARQLNRILLSNGMNENHISTLARGGLNLPGRRKKESPKDGVFKWERKQLRKKRRTRKRTMAHKEARARERRAQDQVDRHAEQEIHSLRKTKRVEPLME